MRRESLASSALLLAVLTAVLTLLAVLFGIPHPMAYLLIIPLLVLQFKLSSYLESYENSVIKLSIKNLLSAGSGLSSRSIGVLRNLLNYLVLVTLLVNFYLAIYVIVTGINLLLVVLSLTLILTCVLVYYIPWIILGLRTFQRKTLVEIELPYVLILLRVASSLKIPIYDVLQLIENSVSLPAISREVKLAKKIATFTSTSFLTAMDHVCRLHPSEKVRELLRRVFISAITMSDVRPIIERVFEEVFSWFESKVLSLIEKFNIIVGASLLAYFFTPVVVSAIAPVFGGGVTSVLVITTSIQFFVFFLIYAIIASLYPSSLIVQSSRKLTLVATFSLVVATLTILYNTFTYASPNTILPPISENIFTPLIISLFAFPLVLAELELRRVNQYDSLVRAVSGALLLAAATGENVAQAIERTSARHGKQVAKLSRDIVMLYTNERLRRAVVMRAPSMYHAAFIETLMVVLRLGSTPDMLKALASSYEKLNLAVLNIRALARRLEGIFVGLIAMVGGFIAYIDRVYNYIASIAPKSPIAGFSSVFMYEPRIYALLNCITLLSVLFVSLFVGLIRGGSVKYSFRTTLAMIVVYTLSRYLISVLPSG